MEKDNLIPSKVGVPQGGLLSPLLSNIYLHELDEYMERQIENLSSAEKFISKVNPSIMKYSKELAKLSLEYRDTKDPEILKKMKDVRQRRSSIPTRIRTGVRIRYCRYADD